MKSASGSGSLPALWAQSASSSDPASRIDRRQPIERLDHAGLVVDLLDRDQRWSGGQHRVECRIVDQPVACRPECTRDAAPIA